MQKVQLLPRRNFLKTISLGGAALALSPRARAAESLPEEQLFPPNTFIDIHTHLGHEWGPRPPLSADQLLRWMDEVGIGQACVLPLISPESYDYAIPTDYVLRETAAHRDRLIPFCSIDPRTDYLGTFEKKRDLLKRYRDAGCRGFGEHKCGVAIDDSRSLDLYRACGEVGFPVLFHIDNGRNMDKPGLPGLDNALTHCPETNFIGHANGFWASISGDVIQENFGQYPSTPVQPGGALDVLMEKHKNLYGDLSAGSGANAIARDITFGREFVLRRQDRLIFGTDYLAPRQKVPQFSLYKNMELPTEVQEKIFRGNARRVLGLS